MPNNMAKMRRTNSKAIAYLKGYKYRFEPFAHTRWSKDHAGLFDGTARRPGMPIIWVSLKTNNLDDYSALKSFSKEFCAVTMSMRWKQRGKFKSYGWDIRIYDNDAEKQPDDYFEEAREG